MAAQSLGSLCCLDGPLEHPLSLCYILHTRTLFVQDAIVVGAPGCWFLDLTPVHNLFIIVVDQPQDCCVTLKLYDSVCCVGWLTVMGEEGEKKETA